MSKSVWKLLGIIALTLLCLWQIYPPKSRLKPGIDIAGGTSLLYEIDTTGMQEWQKRQASEEMIRVLQQRIDPDNQMNLIWRPQGSNRIEIQMPLASEEMRKNRKLYQELKTELEEGNIPRAAVEHALKRRPTEMDQDSYAAGRAQRLQSIAQGSAERLAKMEAVAHALDGFEQSKALLNESLAAQKAGEAQVTAAELPLAAVEDLCQRWNTLSDPCQAAEAKALAGEDAGKEAILRGYIQARAALSSARETQTAAEAALNNAWSVLESENVDMDRLERFLERKGSVREAELSRLKAAAPVIAEKLTRLVAVYDAFASKAGRLDDPEDLKKKLLGSGVLEFRILPLPGEQNAPDAMAIKRYVELLEKFGPNPLKSGDKDYAWRKVRDPEGFKNTAAILAEFAGDTYVLASNKENEVLLKGQGNWSLRSARPDSDQFGALAVAFEFNAIGASKFSALTGGNLKRALAILLDGEVFSAPTIQSMIHERGQITGQFTQTEIQNIVDKLNAGSLPARLSDQPISVNSVGATMGEQNIKAGLQACYIGFIAVLVFMILYYRFSGLLAAIAVLMNLLIVLAIMAFTRATFTLPGIAGLILTMGMAVDANVLINERIREEQHRGSSLRIAIKNGYDRAFTTIFDSNLTTFISAFILRLVASEEIKGFALTLMIGIMTSMFTALFVTHVIFDVLTEKRWLKQLSMGVLFQNLNVNWMGMRKGLIFLSTLAVIGCWVMYGYRHSHRGENSPYAIEFTGGTSVRVTLNTEAAAELDNEKLEQLFAAYDASLEEQGSSDPPLTARIQRIGAAERREYEIVTPATNIMVVHLGLDAGAYNAAEMQQRIRQAARDKKDACTALAYVRDKDGKLVLETGQTSQRRVREILATPGLLPEGTVIDDAMIETREVVTGAIKTILKDYLTEQSNLHPTVTVEAITEEVMAQRGYLTPEMRGGLLVRANFGPEAAESLERLEQRFDAYRQKEEISGSITWKMFAPGNSTNDMKQPLNGLEIAIMNPALIYDPGAGVQEKAAWDSFAGRQQAWFTGALEEADTLPWVTQIDPSIGQKAMNDAVVGLVLSMLAIIVYLWLRFGTVRFGWTAVVALVHDVSIGIGMVMITPWLAQTGIGKMLLISDFKIDPNVIAALLTLIGFSINDTIVIYDRIRENRGKLAILNAGVINRSINQTMSRTVLTSFTVLLVLVVMYVLGGPGLRAFNYVMLVGVIVGTYSTVVIASGLLYGFGDKSKDMSAEEASSPATSVEGTTTV